MTAQRHVTRIFTDVLPSASLAASQPAQVAAVHDRYGDLRDTHLAITLSIEDRAELAGLDPLERTTCWTHRRWLHQCISSPLHVIVVTGHRWCRSCACAVTVAVDELSGDVQLTCPRCGQTPDTRATRQITRACRASLAAASESRTTGPVSATTDVLGRRGSWAVRDLGPSASATRGGTLNG